MAAQTQDDDDDDVLGDAAEPQPTGTYGTAAAPPPADDSQAAPGEYTDNQKMGMAAIAMLTPLLGGLVGGRTGAMAGAAGAGQGIGAQVQSDTNFERQQALYGQRYGRQNKLGYEVRRQLIDGVPTDVVFDRVTGKVVGPAGTAYTAAGESNAVPGAAAAASAPADAASPAPASDDSSPPPAAPAPAPTDPVSRRLAELDDMMPSDDDLDPARQDGESLAQARARVTQAQATKAHVMAEQGKLKDAVALGKGPKAAAGTASDDSDGSDDAGSPADPSAPSTDSAIGKRWDKVNAAMNPANASSRSDMGRNATTVTNSNRILAVKGQLLSQSGGADNRQMHEIALASAALLTGGSPAAQATVQALIPHTAGTTASTIAEWLTNAPQGTEQQAFINRMFETAEREKVVSQETIKGYQNDELVGSRLDVDDPAGYAKRQAYVLGRDAKFDEDGHYIPKSYQPAAPATSAASKLAPTKSGFAPGSVVTIPGLPGKYVIGADGDSYTPAQGGQ